MAKWLEQTSMSALVCLRRSNCVGDLYERPTFAMQKRKEKKTVTEIWIK